jgi:hypothetical protein
LGFENAPVAPFTQDNVEVLLKAHEFSQEARPERSSACSA